MNKMVLLIVAVVAIGAGVFVFVQNNSGPVPALHSSTASSAPASQPASAGMPGNPTAAAPTPTPVSPVTQSSMSVSNAGASAPPSQPVAPLLPGQDPTAAYKASPQYKELLQLKAEYRDAKGKMGVNEADALYLPRMIAAQDKATAAYPTANTETDELKAVFWSAAKSIYKKEEVIRRCQAFIQKYPNNQFVVSGTVPKMLQNAQTDDPEAAFDSAGAR